MGNCFSRPRWGAQRTLRHDSSPVRSSKGSSDVGENRYAALEVLKAEGVSSVIWLEDFLIHYGSDTQVWDVAILVKDPISAAVILQHANYAPAVSSGRFDNDPVFCAKGIRLRHPNRSTTTILYSSEDWRFNLDPHEESDLPRLCRFIDSVTDMWLNMSSQDYVERLYFALYLVNLIQYCYRLDDPLHGLVNSEQYAAHLQEEHRELHYDIVAAGPKKNFAHTARHRYHVRRYEEIKRGDFKPQPHTRGIFQAELTALQEESQ